MYTDNPYKQQLHYAIYKPATYALINQKLSMHILSTFSNSV